MSIESRLSRLESREGPGCPECRRKLAVPRVFYPDDSDPDPQPEHCPRCGRPLGVVIRVVYEEEGEGAYS